MTCLNRFCVHYENEHCGLNEVSIDEMGFCGDIFFVDVEDVAMRR